MFDTIKKGILAGLGLAVVSKEEIENVVDKLVREGRIQAESGQRVVEELFQDTQDQWSRVQGQIRETVRSAMDNLDIGSRREFKELEARVRMLEERISLLENAARPETPCKEIAEG